MLSHEVSIFSDRDYAGAATQIATEHLRRLN
jgi:hypothetical protein